MEETNIETVEMMATSSADTFFISDDITEDDARMGRGRRGSWGNLWNGEE